MRTLTRSGAVQAAIVILALGSVAGCQQGTNAAAPDTTVSAVAKGAAGTSMSAEAIMAKCKQKPAAFYRDDCTNVADLKGITVDGGQLAGNFAGVDLSGSTFRNMSFVGSNFRGANLTGVTIESSRLSGVSFQDANLSGATLSQNAYEQVSDAGPANFTGANLTGATLNVAVNEGHIAFTGATLKGTTFQDGGWAESDFVELKDISNANFSGTDARPDGFTLAGPETPWQGMMCPNGSKSTGPVQKEWGYPLSC